MYNRWFASSALVALALASPALAAKPANAEAERIAKLEAEVNALLADNQRLHAESESLSQKAKDLAAQLDQVRQAQTDAATAVSTQVETQNAAIKTIDAKIPAPPAATVAMTGGKPVLSDASGRFTFAPHVIMQLDTAAYLQAAAGPVATDFRRSGPAVGATASNVDLTHARELKDGTNFRRARLAVDGTAFGDWDYRFMMEFGGSGVENTGQIYETWIQYSGFKPLRIKVGAFPPAIGLEDMASTNGMPFIERSAAEDLARGLAAGDTRLAAQVYGYGDYWFASAAVTGRTIGTLSTGTATAVPQTYGDQRAIVGRISVSPLHGKDWRFQAGVHGSYVDHPPNTAGPNTLGVVTASATAITLSNTPELRVDGTRLVNTGALPASSADTLGAEFALQRRNFLVQGEYEDFGVRRIDLASSPHFNGYYVEGLWTLTGEPRVFNRQTAAYDAPVAAHPFNPRAGAWGALEIGFRYSVLDLNYHAGLMSTAPAPDAIRGGRERNLSFAIDWYPNSVVRFIFDIEHVTIDRLSPNAALYSTPVGAQIGQSYDALAVRSQFAF
jgi:phosphate-selective porin OprO and OprP